MLEEEIGAFESYLQNNAITRTSNPNASVAEKTQLLYGNAEYIVEKAFSGGQGSGGSSPGCGLRESSG